ncbi:MAG TPA: hypothetical protein VJR27_05900 [Candidatus Saccharimonadales bacterium]|nr:hypothetical protein [Candidatus Saccharimonadales bacterium]
MFDVLPDDVCTQAYSGPLALLTLRREQVVFLFTVTAVRADVPGTEKKHGRGLVNICVH